MLTKKIVGAGFFTQNKVALLPVFSVLLATKYCG